MSRKLVVKIKASETMIDLDDYYEADEEIDEDGLYDGFIHEIATQPEYTWEIVDG